MSKDLNARYVADAEGWLRGQAPEVVTPAPTGFRYYDAAGQPATLSVSRQAYRINKECDEQASGLAGGRGPGQDAGAQPDRTGRLESLFREQAGDAQWRHNVIRPGAPVLCADISMLPNRVPTHEVDFQAASGRGLIRAYFLPWRENQVTCLPLGSKADFFFTTTLEGCSLYIGGDERSPVVFQGNARDAPTAPSGRVYLDTLVQRAAAAGLAGAAGPLEPILSSESYAASAARLGIPQTPETAPKVTGLANVFGFRRDGRWSFYAQQFATAFFTWTEAGTPEGLLKEGVIYNDQSRNRPAPGQPDRKAVRWAILLRPLELLWPR